MRYFIAFLICTALITVSSCRKDFTTNPSTGNLEFSVDTLFLDTIFSNIGSSTYTLKVYNRSNNSLSIPEIKLENGSTSSYRLNVDGIPGKSFNDIDILAKDSIFIFVETTVDATNTKDLLYIDRILFDNGEREQDVDLVTLVQDANFIFAGRDAETLKVDSLTLNNKATTLKGRFLNDSELVFSKNKPTVIYGFAAIPENKTLIIEAGAKVHFHDNSGLIVTNQASLKSMGTLENKIIFEGDRLEPEFSNVPGQWSSIWLQAGSKENEIKHTVIKNAVVGVIVDSIGTPNLPTLQIENSEIYNNASFGLLGRGTNIKGHNLVIGNAGQSSLSISNGGTYNFNHCTFANFWTNDIRLFPAVSINNFSRVINDDESGITETTSDLKEANFTNCIFYGNDNIEFIINRAEEAAVFNYNISNCIIKFNDNTNAFENNEDLDFSSAFYQDIILNGNPDFRDPTKEEFIIGEESEAIDKAKASTFSTDILGINRTANPDIGAYQHIIFEVEEEKK